MNGLGEKALRRCAIARALLAACVAGIAFVVGVGVGAEAVWPEPAQAVIERHDGRSWIVFDDRGTHYVLEFEEVVK